MNKIYQTLYASGEFMEKIKGNCMQAAYASMFEKELDEVPHILAFGTYWKEAEDLFLKSIGYEIKKKLYNEKLFYNNILSEESKLSELKNYKDVNGCYIASVGSPNFFLKNGGTHMVLIDKNFNIIHDPNENYKDLSKYPLAEEIGFNGIRQILIIDKIK